MQNTDKNQGTATQFTQADLLQSLVQQFGLNDLQQQQIQRYCQFLLEQNQNYNLTGHKNLDMILSNLFADSLQATKFIDFSTIQSIADVGTGAGFPGMPLKIAYPHLHVTLIEVNKKKIQFLQKCVEMLQLENVTVVDVDWRTFNRRGNSSIDLFVSKAVFDETEMCRMFRSNGLYRDKKLLYWASEQWQCDPAVQKYCRQIFNYANGDRAGKLVLFADPATK